MALVSALVEILQRPTIGDVLTELVLFTTPLWIAVLVGVLVGWAWKPKWANLTSDSYDSSASEVPSSPPSTASSSGTSTASCSFPTIFSSFKSQLPSCISSVGNVGMERGSSSLSSNSNFDRSSSHLEKAKSVLVGEDDLEHLCRLVEEEDGGPAWIQMMDRSTPTMSYRAWRRDPENGPPQYRTSTIFDNANPEMVRNFFWDDDFRLKWDDMLIHGETLEECLTTGTMVVQWVRKFPFFCSDREYIIGRRIWESAQSYYCVTKGVPYPSVPRRNKPKRVDLYYSSWHIRAVKSKREDGQLTACEVLLFHHEDMGIPWEIAKLGVRQGMWGAVKKVDPGLRAYQRERESGAPLSQFAFMAQINTKVSADYLRSLESRREVSPSEVETLGSTEKPLGRSIPKLLVVGGAVALACSLDQGLLTKVVIFGVARKFAMIGKKWL